MGCGASSADPPVVQEAPAPAPAPPPKPKPEKKPEPRDPNRAPTKEEIEADAAVKLQARWRGHCERTVPRKLRRFAVLGAPGSGKRGLCALVQQKYGVSGWCLCVAHGVVQVVHVSAGGLLREQIEQQTPVGMRVQQTVGDGKLVADDIVIKLVRSALSSSRVCWCAHCCGGAGNCTTRAIRL